ncbi:MAG: WD40 repeat domain-containing protein [Rhizonema sp. PD38]|nr:WD40 repeat domain-containing protein [Rhizonema sp. PD38]
MSDSAFQGNAHSIKIGQDVNSSTIISGDGNVGVQGDRAIITITNYYYYEDTKVVTVEYTDTADDENLPCPYRGLFHFGPDDAEFFYGREVFVEELLVSTKKCNFIPILGASGSGKSSVVLAGLVPKLQQEGHWKFTHFRPGVVRKKELRSIFDPFYAIATALVPLYTPHLDKTKQLAQASDLADLLRDGKILLSDVIAAIQQNYPNHRVLLIADQFEEIYTICHEENIRRHFLDILIDNIYSPIVQSQSPLVLVLAMRADFLGNALSYRPFADVLRNADIKLGAMNRQELSQVIEKPAEKLGVKFEAGLVERILDDVEDEPGNLPLVEFALTLLWQRRTGKQLSHAAYDAIGQVEGALANYADDKYDRLIQVEQEQTRRILIQLVRPGEGTEDTRRLATKEELGEENWFLVQQLADARLVVTSRNAAGQETVEVVHEALIQNWVKLRQWMETDRDFRAWQERLRTALRQWEETKRDEGALLRGVPLAVAEEWLRKRPVDLSVTEQQYIRRSAELRDRLLQEEEERRQRELEAARKIAEESEARRTAEEKARQEAEQRAEQQANANKQLRRGAVALGASLLVAIGAGGIAWNNQQKALQRELTARQNFYTSSLNLANQNFDKAQIIQFANLIDNLKPQSNQKDLRGFEWYYFWKLAHSDKLTIQHDQAVTSVAISPDGKTLATINSNGRTMNSKNSVKLWDMATGK